MFDLQRSSASPSEREREREKFEHKFSEKYASRSRTPEVNESKKRRVEEKERVSGFVFRGLPLQCTKTSNYFQILMGSVQNGDVVLQVLVCILLVVQKLNLKKNEALYWNSLINGGRYFMKETGVVCIKCCD